MKKILFVMCLLLAGSFAFGQTLTWPKERSVYQRTGSDNADIWFCGMCSNCSESDVEVRIDGNIQSKSGWVANSTEFKFKINKAIGWYNTTVNIKGTPVFNNKKVGVGDVYIVSGQSNSEGKYDSGNDIQGAISDMVNCIPKLYIKSSIPINDPTKTPYIPLPSDVNYINDDTQSSAANQLSTYQNVSFGKMTYNYPVGPRGRGGWFWANLGDKIAINKSIPTLFINAAYEGTSIVAWKKSKDSPNGNVQHPSLNTQYPVGMPFSILKNSILAYSNILGLRAIIWQHGEADNGRTSYIDNASGGTQTFDATKYKDFLNEIITETKNLSGGSNITWIINSASYVSDSPTPVDNTIVRSGQSQVLDASKNIIFGLDTDWFYSACRRDNVHFSSNKFNDIAEGFYQMLYNTSYVNAPKCDNSTYNGPNTTLSKIVAKASSDPKPSLVSGGDVTCNNGPNPFSVEVLNFNPVDKTLNFIFNASNLRDAKWTVTDLSGNEKGKANFEPNQNTKLVPSGITTNGDYKLILEGLGGDNPNGPSCTGSTFVNFNVSTIDSPPSGEIDLTEFGSAIEDNQNNPFNEKEIHAFDNLTNTKWLVFNPTGNIGYDFANEDAYVVTKYTVTSANDESNRDPKSWKFQGSNDGTVWFNVDIRSNQSFGDRFQKKEFGNLSNSIAYKRYRLEVTENHGAPFLQIAEIQMFGVGTPPTTGSCADFTEDKIVGWATGNPSSTIFVKTVGGVKKAWWSVHQSNVFVDWICGSYVTPASGITVDLLKQCLSWEAENAFGDPCPIPMNFRKSTPNTYLQPDDVTISPNPNNGIFKVNVMSNAEKEVELLISNKSGKVLTTRKVKLSEGSNTFDFKISEMEGLYILNVVDGNVRFKKQIAKIEE